MITHFFRVGRAEEKTRFEIGKCPISADLVTACIHKADTVVGIPEAWFEFNKPMEWKIRKCPTAPHGILKFMMLNLETATGLLYEDVERELADPESGVKMPRVRDESQEALCNGLPCFHTYSYFPTSTPITFTSSPT